MWEYDAYHDSIITAGNGGTQPIQARFTLFYNQGKKRYDMEQTLQPDGQMWVDVGQIIREQIPDKNGNTLPPTLTTGSYEITDLSHHGAGTLFEGKVIYDKMYGNAAYGCALCCGYATIDYGFWYDPLGIPDLGTAPQGVQALDKCEDEYDDVSDAFYGSWTTGNSSVATVDHYGTHTGTGLGSTTSNAHGELNSNDVPQMCPLHGYNPTGGDNTTASVKVSGPAYVPLRASGSTGPNSMNATATGSPSGGTYTWSTTSSNVSLTNTNSATVTVTSVNASASQNDTPLTVKYVVNSDTNCSNPSDCSTASMNITVSKPTSLSLISDNSNPSGHTCNASAGSNDCSVSKFAGTGSYTSYLRTRDYQIMDQFTHWISGYALQIQESYTPPTGQCASDEINTSSGNGDTATDCFYFCSSTCQGGGSCGVSATQTVTVNGFQVATKSVGWSCSGATITP